ncbi:MAG TPA: CcoQ/FixQ family Cbb3-type cytochrome c oxidase assembly chaperone [Chromatiales bacterium]|nr:CcoQ/FixQ family Cbb3-type cytochrome c oxidase assembly chaperone [Chromatiales bacterium]
MDWGTVQGVVTAVLIVVYAGIFAWAWSPARRKAFAEAARAPLEEEAAAADGGRDHE